MTHFETAPEPVYMVTDKWGDPNEIINTQWGKISYSHWCDAEVARWKDKWRTAWVVEHPGNEEKGIKQGSIAIFSFRKYMQIPLEDDDK